MRTIPPLGSTRAHTTAGIVGSAGFLARIAMQREVADDGGQLARAGDGRLWGCTSNQPLYESPPATTWIFKILKIICRQAKLFEGHGAGATGTAILNADDPYSKRLAGLAGRGGGTLTLHRESSRTGGKQFQLSFNGLPFTCEHSRGENCKSLRRSWAAFNVYHILAAIGEAQAVGFPTEVLESAFARWKMFEKIFSPWTWDSHFWRLWNFAHTDERWKI